MKPRHYLYKGIFELRVKREEHGKGYIIMSRCVADDRKTRRFNSNLYSCFKEAQTNLDGMARAVHLQEIK